MNPKNSHVEKALYAGIVVLMGAIAAFSSVLIASSTSKHEVVVAPVIEDVQKENPYAEVLLSAKAGIVYDLVTGETLYEKNADSQLPLASLTKMLTVYTARTMISSGTSVSVSATAMQSEGDSGFLPGDTFTFNDLAKMALVASSNDAASAIAEETNRRDSSSRVTASVLTAANLNQTYVLNATGLDENTNVSGGYGSARDIAELAGLILKQIPEIAEATTKSHIQTVSTTGKVFEVTNTNPDIEKIAGARFSKTGFTDLAGGNLAIVVDVGINHPISVVVLGSTREERFTDVQKLLKATSNYFTL